MTAKEWDDKRDYFAGCAISGMMSDTECIVKAKVSHDEVIEACKGTGIRMTESLYGPRPTGDQPPVIAEEEQYE